MDQVSGLADKEGWIKIIDFLKFATDTELCKIEFTDRVFASKSHFGSKDSEKEKDERKKDPKLKVNKIEIFLSNSARLLKKMLKKKFQKKKN